MQVRLLILLLLSGCAAFADNITNLYVGFQVTNGMPLTSVYNVSAPAAPFTLTNEPTGSGTNLQAWWRGDSYTTNSGTFQLTDIAGVNNWHLTNQRATSVWPVRTTNNTWVFNGSVTPNQYVQNMIFTNSGVREIWIVTKLANAGSNAITATVFDTRNTTYRGAVFSENTATKQASMQFGENTQYRNNADQEWTNHWLAFFFASDGTPTTGKGYWGTNNVMVDVNVAFGGKTASGFIINGRANDAFWGWGQEWAEAFAYSATNGLVAHSNIWYYIKNFSPVCTNFASSWP